MQHNHPLYRDDDRLANALDALTRLRRNLSERLSLPLAEACLDDTDDLLDALLAKLTAARDLTHDEAVRVEQAEFAASHGLVETLS